ncbi:TPA: AraC family transcriptional regulator [Vibrio campbellii]|uniref:AraC family transcriptional regulator n=1 Tax=Vibrio sp. B181a TaxID=2835906 RepID=UPI002553AA58|nr:AraC family transcriptional regulator [Vibrio sp. B181a]MDK9772837.1 AraC family transcriptional regulator [Vibrio sp. B181a]HDM8231559.1 AraC family transcriptional regulator [Vibrio campbellii]
MNYAIEFHDANYPFLNVAARKKALKHSLLSVVEGLAIIKLGKHEYAIEPGQHFWIPQGCLSSLTFLPNTRVTRCDFSVRLADAFAQQAGYVKPSALLSALIEKLVMTKARSEHQLDLLAVVKHEVLALKPMLTSSALTDSINKWKPGCDSQVSIELCLVLTLREARKMKLSGKKQSDIVAKLFNNNEEEYEQLCFLVFGEAL